MKRGIEQFCRHRDEYPRVSLSRQLSPVTFRAYDSGFYHYISRFNDLLFACYAPLGRAPFTLTNGFYDCWRRWSVDCTVPRLEETKEIDGQLCVRIVPLFPAVPIAPSTLAPVYIVSSTSEPLYLETALLNNRERREFCRGPTVARTLQDEYILFALGCSGLSPELDSRLDYYSFYF